MVLVTYFGILAHRSLVTGAESLIYATSPVDQYCKGETEAPFPCEELERSDFYGANTPLARICPSMFATCLMPGSDC